MILLTRLNDAPIAVNCDLIQFIEETPDTVLTLSNHEKIVVREGMHEVVRRVVDFKHRISVGDVPELNPLQRA